MTNVHAGRVSEQLAMADEHDRVIEAGELTKFKTRILAILAEEGRYGLAIKRELEAAYGEEVNHGRLYPNLDDLVERGLVEKSALDRRTNNYAITDEGRAVVEAEAEWLRKRLEGGEA